MSTVLQERAISSGKRSQILLEPTECCGVAHGLVSFHINHSNSAPGAA